MRNTKPSTTKDPSRSQKKRSSSRKKSPSCPSASESTALDLQSDDLLALEAFCENLEIDEITMSEWEHGFESLDLTVPIWITFNDASHGCEKIVSYSRSVQVDGDKSTSREPMQVRIQIPPETQHQSKISVPGNGDVMGGRQGDLIVIIHIKS